MRKRIFSLLAALALLSCMTTVVWAHSVPDESEKGSITVTMHKGETIIPGGSLTIYRVGEIYEEDGNYSFRPTGDFAGCGLSYEHVESGDLAAQLAKYAQDKKLKGETKQIDQKGTVSFGDLELGLYLLVQNESAEGYLNANPFLVSVPKLEDGKYVYHVDASPKVEAGEKDTSTTAPTTEPSDTTNPDTTNPSGTTTSTGSGSSGGSSSSGSKLPQTGQLNWPVPVLVVLGLGLFAAGWVLRFSKKEGKD